MLSGTQKPPSCVVGSSQTRPVGTGQFHFKGTDGELGTGDRHHQFHRERLHEILLLCKSSKQKDFVRSHRPLSRHVVLQIL